MRPDILMFITIAFGLGIDLSLGGRMRVGVARRGNGLCSGFGAGIGVYMGRKSNMFSILFMMIFSALPSLSGV